MLARFLHSGKFWLKLIIFGGFSMLLLVLGLYTALYQMFDAAKIQTLLNESIEGSGRSARFDAQIGRSLSAAVPTRKNFSGAECIQEHDPMMCCMLSRCRSAK